MIWVGATSSVIVIGVVGAALYSVREFLPIVGISFVATLAALPLGLAIWFIRRMTRPQIIDINTVGTIIRDTSGRLVVISPEEMHVMESTHEPLITFETSMQEEYPREETFTSFYNNTSVNAPLTERKQPVNSIVNSDVNMPEAIVEQRKTAEELLLEAENAALKERIQQLRSAGLSKRVVAKLVGLEGRHYPRFQSLCEELGDISE